MRSCSSQKIKKEAEHKQHKHASSIVTLDLGLHDLDSSDTEDFDHLNYESTPNNRIEEKMQHKKHISS